MTMFSYLGMESATIPAGSVEDPGKLIPKATILGLIIAALVYILGSATVMGLIPAYKLEHSVTPYADAAVILYGNSAKYWVSAGVAIAAFGALNGWMLVQGQVPYAVAKDKLFPPPFARLNKKDVPYFGIMITAIVMSIFIAMNYQKGLVEQFKFFLLFAVLTSLVPFLFSVAAYPIIRARKKISGGWTAALVLTFLAFGYNIWMISGTGKDAVYYGFLLLMMGVPLYMWLAYKKENTAKAD